jgi:hypothetical protein
MKKFGLLISFILFITLIFQFASQENTRYEIAKEETQKIVNNHDHFVRGKLYDIVEVNKNTFLNIESIKEKVVKEQKKGWVLKDGSVVDLVDMWMMPLLKRKAAPEEVQNMFREIFEVYSSGFYISSFVFYFLHLVMFIFASIAPILLSFIFSAAPTAISLKYAGALGLILLMIVKTKADDTSFEVDLSCNGEKNNYEFFLMNFTKRMTNIFYIPSGSVIAATGPSFSIAGGNLSVLGGARFGASEQGVAVSNISSWYIFFTSFFNQKLDYVTFGLYEKSIRSDGWWAWFKHQFNLPIGQRVGIGVREDTIIDPTGWHTTYGPVLQLKWNSAVIHMHGRFGGDQRSLFMRLSVPIN